MNPSTTPNPILFLAGHRGMVGSAIARQLQAKGPAHNQPERLTASTQPMCSHINVGTSVDVTIRELAETFARVTGYRGALRFDPSKPDGPPRKLLDISRLSSLRWRAQYDLEAGLRQTYHWFCDNLDAFRR